jgi:short-subunit dehydrogenase
MIFSKQKTFPEFSLALVTGASSGIGTSLCRLLARQGIPLLVTGRNSERLNALAEELKTMVPVIALSADLSLPQDREKLVEKINAYAPDLVVNNAGFGLYGEALSYETKEQLEIVNINASTVLSLTLESARAMIAQGKKGVILNVSSSADFLVFPGLAVYAATKAFVTQFSLDFEMRQHGVRVLAACPGVVETNFRSRASGVVQESSNDPSAMSAEFAAKKLWWQIKKRKRVHMFDWKTRVAVCFARYFMPKALLAPILAKTIASYHPKRSLVIKR